MKSDPVAYWKAVYPERTCRVPACSADALTANFTSVFDLTCEQPTSVCE